MVLRHSSAVSLSFALAVALSLSSAHQLPAQSPAVAPLSNWELNLHAATMRPALFDESSGALQFGGRLFRNFGNGLSLGANVDWARTGNVTVAPFDGLSASFLLYSAELGYDVRVSPRAVFHLGVGVGQAKLDLDRALAGAAQSSTGLLVPAGGGIKIHNRAVAPSWAIRFDVRDNVILLETVAGDATETEPRHNIEASVGFSFLFGNGEPRAPEPAIRQQPGAVREEPAAPVSEPAAERPPDADGDGVSDFADACPTTSAGAEVDSDGCATGPEVAGPAPDAEAEPADADGDGVLDGTDDCPGTPLGIAVDARGCLARIDSAAEPGEPEAEEGPAAFPVPIIPPQNPAAEAAAPVAAGACLEESDAERAMEFDGRRFEPVGFPQPVDRLYLVQIGSFEGIPLFVSDTAEPPYGDFWVPLCGQTGIYDLFVEAGAAP